MVRRSLLSSLGPDQRQTLAQKRELQRPHLRVSPDMLETAGRAFPVTKGRHDFQDGVYWNSHFTGHSECRYITGTHSEDDGLIVCISPIILCRYGSSVKMHHQDLIARDYLFDFEMPHQLVIDSRETFSHEISWSRAHKAIITPLNNVFSSLVFGGLFGGFGALASHLICTLYKVSSTLAANTIVAGVVGLIAFVMNYHLNNALYREIRQNCIEQLAVDLQKLKEAHPRST
ncbi:MAG: hypothetical protein ABII22_03980 [Candidatus Micrarchaeota archaeon]